MNTRVDRVNKKASKINSFRSSKISIENIGFLEENKIKIKNKKTVKF